jgi:hypothetical protein
MSNKLKWFTHDNDALEDDFIQASMDRFGHFGYAAYFIILELIHRHGTNNCLTIPLARLCQKLRSRRTQVRLYLDFSRTSAKMEVTWSGDEVQLQIKKFNERQRKLRYNRSSTVPQDSPKVAKEREGEGERHNKQPTASALPNGVDKAVDLGPYKIKTKAQAVICAYKVALGLAFDDRAWDKANYARYAKCAGKLLDAFGGLVAPAQAYIIAERDRLCAKGLSWTLETVERNAWKDPEVQNVRSQSAVANSDPAMGPVQAVHQDGSGANPGDRAPGIRKDGKGDIGWRKADDWMETVSTEFNQ